jgi:pimeloyl-ACP methyl ester carboxylesterase
MGATIFKRIQEVTFRHDETLLRGAVYNPPNNNRCPIVLLVPGHGLRTNSLDAHGSFDYLLPLIGYHLVQHGIAVFQYSRPGTGGSSGDWRFQTLYDRADEVLAAIQCLRTNPALSPTHIGVLGHSNGGWVAPLAATLSEDIQFIVTVAGPGISLGAQALSAFRKALWQKSVSATYYAELMSYAHTTLTLYRLLVQGKRTEFQILKDSLKRERPLHPEWLQEFSFTLPTWKERGDILRSMDGLVDYDAVSPLRQLRCPALAIFGENDSAFDSLESAAIFAQAFREGGNTDTSIQILPGAGHRMQIRQEDGNMQTEPSFQPLVSTWIGKHTDIRVG